MKNKYPECNTSGCTAYKAREKENQRLTKALEEIKNYNQCEWGNVPPEDFEECEGCVPHTKCPYYAATKALAATPEPQQKGEGK
jgi:hypothetical protein